MDVALSPNGRRVIRVFFALVLVFLYAPIVILLIFSFNKASVPTFPLSGFTFRWYREFATNGEMQAALETSAIVAAISSVIAVALGVLASLALSRRPFRGQRFPPSWRAWWPRTSCASRHARATLRL